MIFVALGVNKRPHGSDEFFVVYIRNSCEKIRRDVQSLDPHCRKKHGLHDRRNHGSTQTGRAGRIVHGSGRRHAVIGKSGPHGRVRVYCARSLTTTHFRHYGLNPNTPSLLRSATVLCTGSILRKKLQISDWPITSNTWLTRFGLANLFTTFPLIAAHSPACKTDNSWTGEHENNDECIFVTTVERAVAHLFAITSS